MHRALCIITRILLKVASNYYVIRSIKRNSNTNIKHEQNVLMSFISD